MSVCLCVRDCMYFVYICVVMCCVYMFVYEYICERCRVRALVCARNKANDKV